jgi:8-oxo-dGTP diphosphatase
MLLYLFVKMYNNTQKYEIKYFNNSECIFIQGRSYSMDFGEVVPGIGYRKRDAVYAVILDPDGEKVAILVQNGKGFLPGGGKKEIEDHESCLTRECIEETGYKINIEHCIGNVKQYFQSKQNEYIMNNGYFYAGEFADFVKPPIDDDHELVWMDLAEANRILFHESHFWAVNETFKNFVRS